MSLFVTRWQGTTLLSTLTYYTGRRAEWRMQWAGLRPMHPALRAERERLLRRVG